MISLFFINGKKLLLILKCRFHNLLMKKKIFFEMLQVNPISTKKVYIKKKKKLLVFPYVNVS